MVVSWAAEDADLQADLPFQRCVVLLCSAPCNSLNERPPFGLELVKRLVKQPAGQVFRPPVGGLAVGQAVGGAFGEIAVVIPPVEKVTAVTAPPAGG